MEFCSGGFINDIEYLKKHNIDLESVSKKVGEMYADMIFKHGYVHCDPHPGNVLVHKNKAGVDEVILLDHGLYTVSWSNIEAWFYNIINISFIAAIDKWF